MNTAGAAYAQDADVEFDVTVITAMRCRRTAAGESAMRLEGRSARGGDGLRAHGGSAFGGVW